MPDDSHNLLKTTTASLHLLETIKRLNGTTASQLEEETGMARSTLHNHLQTLLDNGYLVKEGNTYQVGMKLLNLGLYVRTRKPGFELAHEMVDMLANRSNMEANFSVEEHGDVIVLFVKSGHTTHSGLGAGQIFPIHATAAGKTILAELPAERRDEILDAKGLPEVTEHTITDRDELLFALELIKERGYATNQEECLIGYETIGTAIKYPDGRIAGALCVGGPVYLFDDASRSKLTDDLLNVATEFERQIKATLMQGVRHRVPQDRDQRL